MFSFFSTASTLYVPGDIRRTNVIIQSHAIDFPDLQRGDA